MVTLRNFFNPNMLRGAFWALALAWLRVTPSAAQCVLACNQNVQVSLDATGQATVSTAMIAPYAALNCTGTLELTVFNTQNNPIPNNILDCSRLNQTLQARVRHVETGNICWGSVVAKDYLPPVLGCAEKFVFCTADTSAQALGFPPASDNCTPLTNANLQRSDAKTDLPCMTMQGGQFVTARIDRTWSTTDGQGNTASCLQKIWVKRATLADVTMPTNLDGFNAPSLNCGVNPNNLAVTGQPTVGGRPILVDGDCELLVSFTDQTINNCPPASYRVLRSWTVSDYCANTFTIHVQVIKVEDKTAPVLTAPADITVGTLANACTATVTLPQASATDDCSSVGTSAAWNFGNGFGPFSGVPMGDHVVTYTAVDACGNSASKTMTVTVIDDKPPTAVCKNTLQVSLSAAGASSINATAFNDGSSDNCGLAPFLASRAASNSFATSVSFSCADIGTPIPVTLKVLDNEGLENTCTTQVTVRDNLKPTIQCPASQTLTCQASFTDPSVTGTALASDNCGSPDVTFTDANNLNTCNTGNIVRTWKATDGQNNTVTCAQTITLNSVATLAVQFPSDQTLNACVSPAALDPAATGQPTLTGQSCQQPSVTFADEIISPAPPNCFNILRKWKVIDWCVYNPGTASSPGIWEHTQLIRVRDNTPPIFTPLPDLTVTPTLTGCFAQVTLAEIPVSDCSANPTVSNNSTYAFSTGANASGAYPPGLHTVVFTATDRCGNTGTASLRITVPTCAPGGFEIKGTLKTENNNAIVNIPVQLKGDGFSETDNCDATGQFQFDDAPGGLTYTLRPTNREKWLNGVSTFDLLLISKHLLGIQPLNSPYKIIAADVNKSNSVSSFDIVQLRKLILGLQDTLPGNASWRFVPADFVFPDPLNPFTVSIPEQIVVQNLSANQANQNFIGFKIGDTNVSANAAEPRSPDSVFLKIENRPLHEGLSLQVPVFVENWKNLEGFQFEMHLDTAKVALRQVILPENGLLREEHFARSVSANGQLRVSWDNSAAKPTASDSLLFTLHLLAKTDAVSGEALRLDPSALRPEAYRRGEAAVANLLLRADEPAEKRGQFALLQNRPNPFRDATVIPFWLPLATDMTLLVSDAMGRIVWQKSEKRPKGYGEVVLRREDLPGKGIYFYYLKSAESPGTGGRLILE